MKEKTLSEKREELFNKLLSKISVSFNDWQDFKKVIKEQDKQFIKEILDEIEKGYYGKGIGLRTKEHIVKIIKQKSGFKDLE